MLSVTLEMLLQMNSHSLLFKQNETKKQTDICEDRVLKLSWKIESFELYKGHKKLLG